MSDLDVRLVRLRVLVAAQLPANYQSIQADVQALLGEYDRVRVLTPATASAVDDVD